MSGGLAANWAVLKSAWADRASILAAENDCDEPAFLPANLEVIQTPPSPLARTLLLCLCGLVVCALLWAVLGQVDVVVVGRGRTLPRGNVQSIAWGGSGETTEGLIGVVRSIHVADGDHVAKGQLLLELDPTLSGANTEQARQALATAEFSQARSRALIGYLANGRLAPRWPAGTTPEQARTETDLLKSSIAEYEAKAGALRSQLAQAQQSLIAADTERTKIAETLVFLDKELIARRTLAEKGFQSKIGVYQLEQQRIEHARDIDLQRSEAEKARAAMAGYRHQLGQLREELSKGSLTALVEAGDAVGVRREEITKALARNSMLQIRAPLAGTVEQLRAHTVGGAVQPAEVLMTLVPDNSPLTVEAQIPNREIGFVRPGQRVTVKVDAFPFTDFGLLHGTLTSLSGMPLAPAEVDPARGGAQETPSVYIARVTLDRASFRVGECVASRGTTAGCSVISLTPGMTLQVEIKTARRRIINYLLSPLQRTMQEAGRER